MTQQIHRHGTQTSMPVLRRIATLMSVVLLAAAAAVGFAACGGSKVASGSGSSRASTATTVAVRYSSCMRDHGVTSFPDPQISSNGSHRSLAIHLYPAIVSSPAFKSAQEACAYLVHAQTAGPNASQQQATTDALLAFARCMREHGFPSFPDPNTQDQPWTLPMLLSAGINLREPAVRPAALACTSVTRGILTKADVESAIANPNELGD